MSLARAIETGDLAELPSRRDEDWRWTDLRGLIRALPKPSPVRMERLIVPAGETRRIDLAFVSAQAGAQVSRIVIEIGESAGLVLSERYEGAPGSLAEVDLRIAVGRAATLHRIVVAADSEDAVSVSRADIVLGPGARLAQSVLTTGAKRQRLETRVSHPGAGASVRLDGLYLLEGRRHADITTVVTHSGVDGVTDQLIKGVVRDQARGVFQGRIVVSPGADKTDARMGHHALILSDRAEVDAKPELEIYADDVVCAHGNTVGALDEEALFYARQRGIPEAEARAMLMEAFVGEVADRIEDEAARAAARAWVAAQLGTLQ
ncbi:MAG: Fe-S cluster assembly protein SufD [Caulobacteraceae bacterium]